MRYPEHLLKLIAVFKKFPGVGNKTAERFAFHLLHWPEEKLREMSETLRTTKENLKNCELCGALIGKEKCSFCNPALRETDLMCIVASPKDIFLIEETREYRGLYHVLGELLSPLQGKMPDQKTLQQLKDRIHGCQVKEVILALDATLEGDATALYLKKEFELLNISTSRLALGLPMGTSLDFVDGGTLADRKSVV